ncbi:hypothetical protein O181_060296 [Austropuccinia psidii MF-1]|uniref:Fe2OG dioxygenase domain-containing protein n=1 Tax=Austropuccinia psidii MF-1 TaxID=1389203 RepID=A0A9Q3EKP3_9BASI|nr:hypothetical protein [Austropuccinia psidii MF-1]
MSSLAHTSIPLIDFSSFIDCDNQRWVECLSSAQVQTAQDIVQAFQTHGFVYLRNFPMPPGMVPQAFQWSEKFFNLPLHIKRQALHPADASSHRGYSPVGAEKIPQSESSIDPQKGLPPPDFKETFEIGKSDKLPKNIWLSEVIENSCGLKGFKEFFEEFFLACSKLQTQILRAISIGLLGIENATYLEKSHQEFNNQIRLAHYPAIKNKDINERCGAHTDFGTITILFQDNVGGLEVENPLQAGHFVSVEPIEGTVVVNIADLLMRWSNDSLKSTLHRVKPPGSIHGVIPSRYSIPFFCGPDPLTVIDSLPGCPSPSKYSPVIANDYILSRIKASY